MAANLTYRGSGPAVLNFGRAIGWLLVNVNSGSTIDLSFDNGITSITIPAGFYSFPVGLVTSLDIIGGGTWQLVAIQA